MSTEERKSFGYGPAGVIVPRRSGGIGLGPDFDAGPNIAGRTALIVGRSSVEMRQFSIWVEQFGGMGVTTQQPAAALRWLKSPERSQALVIFDADDVGDADDVVDFGFAMRAAAPDVPVIMLSSQVKRNDFSSERMMICDATLKNPVTLTAFRLGLEAALQNHAHYLAAVRPVTHG